MKKSRDSRFWVKVLVWIALGILIFVLGYAARVFEEASSQALPSAHIKPLVDVSYSGGFMLNPEQATAFDRIYEDGRVFQVTRGGKITLVRTLSSERVEELRELIAEPEVLSQAFVEGAEYCPSIADGIDAEWSIQLPNGQTAVYSNCDYNIQWENPFFQKTSEFIGEVGE